MAIASVEVYTIPIMRYINTFYRVIMQIKSNLIHNLWYFR
jgi:hypothetical protein